MTFKWSSPRNIPHSTPASFSETNSRFQSRARRSRMRNSESPGQGFGFEPPNANCEIRGIVITETAAS